MRVWCTGAPPDWGESRREEAWMHTVFYLLPLPPLLRLVLVGTRLVRARGVHGQQRGLCLGLPAPWRTARL